MEGRLERKKTIKAQGGKEQVAAMEHRQVLLQNHHALQMAAGRACSPPQAPTPTHAAQTELFAEMGIGHQDEARRFGVLLALAGEPLRESFNAIYGAEQQILLLVREDFQVGKKLRQTGVVEVMASRALPHHVEVLVLPRQMEHKPGFVWSAVPPVLSYSIDSI